MLINDKVDAVYIPDSPSRIKATDYNQIKNEIQECITEAGLTPTKDVIQLPQALKILTAQSGAEEVAKIEAAGKEQLDAVNTAGQTQTAAVNAAGDAQMNNINTSGAQAVQDAQDAANTATSKATEAAGSATDAAASAAQAQQSAQGAARSAEASSSSASAAQTSETAAQEYSANADAKAAQAQNYAQAAQTSAADALSSAQDAAQSAQNSRGFAIGTVYYSQSSLATDNPGALPLFTGETIASANTIYPDFYNWVSAHTELQCTSAEYESALSTYGECPKYVIGSGSLRLPKLSNYIKAANTAEGITQKEAGLPNITGRTGRFAGRYEDGTGALRTVDYGQSSGTRDEQYNSSDITIDASLSNPIYGKSDTVTPAHTTLYPWVAAYNAAVPASTAQAAEFQNALSGKADVDLSNITILGKKSSVSWIMPDYSRSVSTGLAGSPTSESTNSYTCPTDGWILMQASKQTAGNTLHFYVNGKKRLQFPAFSASYGNLMYPVRKGDVIYLRTDATSATWFINWCDFTPCKGA